MTPRQRLIAVAGLAFGVSFFLPALDKESGSSCFMVCLSLMLHPSSSPDETIWGWLYYSGFIVANALFVVLLCASWLTRCGPRVRLCLAAASLLQVVSWLGVNLYHKMADSDDFSVRLGYYLWLAAFGLLFLAQWPAPGRPASDARAA